MADEGYRYWAFISYSHADERWAAWLHRALEQYRLPRRLRGRVTAVGALPARLFPVFRDRDELAGSSSLGPELQRALQSSRSLIVICSPRSARSRWVNEEIRHFKSLGRADRVFALIVDGEPHAADQGRPESECFPEALRRHVDATGRTVPGSAVEPIAADARPQGDGKPNARLKLVAGVLGIGFDELKRRDLQARNRRLAILSAVASGVAALTVVLAIQAHVARNDAERRQRQAEDLIEFMLGDLRQKLEPIGKLDILDAVGDKAMSYFATLDPHDVTDAVLQSRATALRQIGEVRAKQGHLAEAAEAFRQALVLDLELVQRHPADARALFNVAESQFSVGYAHYAKGESDLALPWFQKQAASIERLIQLEPENDRWRIEAGNAEINLGALALQRGDPDGARRHYERALAAQEPLLERAPDTLEFVQAVARVHRWLNHVDTVRRDHDRAIEHARLQTGLMRRLIAQDPEHAAYRLSLATALQQQAYNMASLGRLRPDSPELREALEITRQLAEHDPANVDYRRAHAVSLSYLEDAQLVQGDVVAALRANDEGLRLVRELHARAPDNATVRDDLLRVLARSVKLAWLADDRVRARALLAEALALPLSEEQRRSLDPARWLELQLLGQWVAAPEERTRHAHEAREWLERVKALPAAVADVLMRYYALNGDAGEAGRWAQRLSDAERRHPFVMQFCAHFPCGLPKEPELTVQKVSG